MIFIWREGVPYACMRGDVEKVAGLTVKEADRALVSFARWNAFPSTPVETRTRNDYDHGAGEPVKANVALRSNRRALAQAAE